MPHRHQSGPLLALAIASALGGCANFNTAFRTYDASRNSAMVDVKQRAIVVGYRDNRSIICAEPSPDSMSAYAAELAGKANIPNQVQVELAAASRESAAYVGLRTQSIQLLRDSMYRLCEGYMNGAIGPNQFDVLAKRYQKNMVALLAIEQLTGTIKAPPVTISSQSNASAAQSLDGLILKQEDYLKKRSEAKREHLLADAAEKDAESKLTAATPPTGQAKTDLENKRSDAQERKAILEEKIANYDKALDAIRRAIADPGGHAVSGNLTATVAASTSAPQFSDAALAKVTATVDTIVRQILDNDGVEQLCIDYLRSDFERQAKVVSLESKDSMTEKDKIELKNLKNEETRVIASLREKDFQGSIRITCLDLIKQKKESAGSE